MAPVKESIFNPAGVAVYIPPVVKLETLFNVGLVKLPTQIALGE
jgi:hypothetical protein